ncbi:MAG: RagB/SusD family nutrient uptake outer membrane protein [Mariniphaga sp.]|nr:RagB/SusD family nutrient uptake outer membrane protein [Mariniphaga sp.]
MKHIKSIIIVAICILLLQTSCESFLEETPIDEITVDYIYSSVDGLEVGVNALYNRQRRNNVPGRCDRNIGLANLMLYLGTDLGHLRGWFNPYESNFHTAARYPDGKWVLSYEIIDRVNAIINSSKDLEQSDRLKTAVAEAKVIRAENYLDLIRMYGIILLDTTHTTPENYQDEVVYEPANQADVYKLIDSDLDYAIANLKYDVESGRYGKGVARHLKGKSAMWQSKWSEAVKQFDAIIEDGPYRLVDLKDVFGQNLNHEEAIYVYPRDDAYGDDDNLAGGDDIWMCGIFNNRYYEMSTGELIKSAELGGQSMGWMYPNDYLQSLYDKDNDKRYTTYYYPTKLYVNNPDHPNFGQEISTYDDNFRRYHWSLKKYHDDDKPLNSNGTWHDLLYYRFAETLLLGAEAHWRLDNENPGNAKALEYINMIRERAFGNSNHNFTEFTLDTYLEESARELAFEKNRWYLLKRTGLLVERQNMYYTKGSNSGNTIKIPMKPYMVNMPISQSQIDLMGTFPQNEGY